MTQPPDRLKVIFLSSEDAENRPLQEILAAYTQLETVYNLQGLPALLDRNGGDVLLCNWSFQDGTWRDIRRYLRERRPELPMIVFSHFGGEAEWVEVLEEGVFDLLSPPYQRTAVLAVLEHAAASSRARCKLLPAPVALAS